MKKIRPWLTGINLIIGIVLLNVLLAFYPFWRIDLSRNKIHSLSPTSRKMIRELDDVVSIKVYMSQNLPVAVKPMADSLKTVLAEFDRLNSKLKISYFDPIKDDEARIEAENWGIMPLQFSVSKSDKFEMSNGYLGLVMVYGDKEEVMPMVNDVGNLEYFLVSGIKRLIGDEIKTIALIEDMDQTGQSQIQYLRQFLARNYQVQDVFPGEEGWLPESVDTLVVVGGGSKMEEEDKSVVEKWLEGNKGLVAFMDKMRVDEGMMAEEIEDGGWWEILEKRGMKVKSGVVWDENSAIANFRSGDSSFLTQYPYWIRVRPENIDRQNPAVSGIDSIMIPWGGMVEIDGEAKVLFSSSQKSVLDSSATNLSPTNNSGEVPGTNWGKKALAAINTEGRKVALVADSDFIKDQFVVSNQQNMFLALNLIDYMSSDESLLTIRSKTVGNWPLRQIEDKLKMTVKVVNVSLPIVLLLIGGFGFRLSRKKKNSQWKKK